MITITRRRPKETKFEQAIGNARRIGAKKVAEFRKVLDELDKKEDRLENAAIRRYAKKHCLVLECHRRPWFFRPFGARGLRVAMPAGYFAFVDRVFHQIVAE